MFIGLIIILILVGVITYFLTRDNQEEVALTKVRLNEVTRSVFYAPQYVAIAKGFMEEEGLEIEITTGQGADKVMTAVLSNDVEIGFAGPEASIYIYNEGSSDYAEVFAQVTKRDGSFLVSREKISNFTLKDGSFLVARNDTDNFSWQDLKGKTIIPGRKGGVPYMTFEYVLKQNGINPSKDLVLDDSIETKPSPSSSQTSDIESNKKKKDYTLYIFSAILLLIMLGVYMIFNKIKNNQDEMDV